MSMMTLRLMADYNRREEDAVDAAVNAASLKNAPPMAKLGLNKVTADKGQLVIDGAFEKSRYGHTVVTINPNTKKGTAESHFFVAYTGTMVSGDVSTQDVVALARRAKAAIDDGNLAASAAVRALLDKIV